MAFRVYQENAAQGETASSNDKEEESDEKSNVKDADFEEK